MKTLERALADYDLAMLRAIAAARNIPLPATRQREAASALAAALATPQAVRDALARLSPQEREALDRLLAAGGQMPLTSFARRYGELPRLGPGRLEREKPWESPATPTEQLWYMGLIYAGFVELDGEPVEVVYLPDEPLELLPPAQSSPPPFEVAAVPPPPSFTPGGPSLAEDLCTLLSFTQNNLVRPRGDDDLSPADRQRLADRLLVAEEPRLDFLLHLAHRLGLLAHKEGRLRPDPETAPDWLQLSRVRQLGSLQETWRDDSSWNDLWRVPWLRCEQTGWSNDPLLSRRKLLAHLAHCPGGEWLSLESFVAAIKEADPDFQRPAGDYDTWYIRDAGSGEYLMGFETWEQVEGALISYVVRGPLHWLGAVDVQTSEVSETSEVLGAFRLTPWAAAGLDLPGEPPAEQPVEPLGLVLPLTVEVPLSASLYDRFQVERFADPVARQEDTLAYQVTPASAARARRQGIEAERIVAFLERASGEPLPGEFVAALEEATRVQLRRGIVVQVPSPEALAELRMRPELRGVLDDTLGEIAVLVQEGELGRVLAALRELGYTPDLKFETETRRLL
jgi:hypothetical protein